MAFNTPTQIIESVCSIGQQKCANSTSRKLLLAILSGVFVGFGGIFAIVVAKGSPVLEAANPGLSRLLFGAVFPVGIIIIVLAGGELFTGNCALLTPCCLSGAIHWKTLLKNWGIVYLGNLLGCLIAALVFAFSTGIIDNGGTMSAVSASQDFAAYLGNQAAAMAEDKVSQGFGTLLIKGVACNWLVCLAVWLSIAAEDVPGKIIGLWFPVVAFAASGFEHSVANMFFIPLGMANGAQVTISQFLFSNLLPVTLGNILGGAVLVGAAYWWVYGKPNPACS